MFGRRYDVFRNQDRVGTLEVSPLHKTSEVRTSIRLEWVRVFPIGTINHVCRLPSNDEGGEPFCRSVEPLLLVVLTSLPAQSLTVTSIRSRRLSQWSEFRELFIEWRSSLFGLPCAGQRRPRLCA